MRPARVGVLALQGAFREHIAALRELGADAFPLRTPEELASADAVVLPGGESTTMDKLLRKFGLREPLAARLRAGMPALATCAGVILLADEIRDGLPDQESLGVLPLAVRRNAYGRQPESFESPVRVQGLAEDFPAVFIRAPVIEELRDGVETLAEVDGAPVAVRSGRIIGLAFHPELTSDRRLHRLFLDLVSEAA
jgi:5'-phosphate synthase pdxT subunit